MPPAPRGSGRSLERWGGQRDGAPAPSPFGLGRHSPSPVVGAPPRSYGYAFVPPPTAWGRGVPNAAHPTSPATCWGPDTARPFQRRMSAPERAAWGHGRRASSRLQVTGAAPRFPTWRRRGRRKHRRPGNARRSPLPWEAGSESDPAGSPPTPPDSPNPAPRAGSRQPKRHPTDVPRTPGSDGAGSRGPRGAVGPPQLALGRTYGSARWWVAGPQDPSGGGPTAPRPPKTPDASAEKLSPRVPWHPGSPCSSDAASSGPGETRWPPRADGWPGSS